MPKSQHHEVEKESLYGAAMAAFCGKTIGGVSHFHAFSRPRLGDSSDDMAEECCWLGSFGSFGSFGLCYGGRNPAPVENGGLSRYFLPSISRLSTSFNHPLLQDFFQVHSSHSGSDLDPTDWTLLPLAPGLNVPWKNSWPSSETGLCWEANLGNPMEANWWWKW